MNIKKSFFILGLLPLAFACTENKTEFAEIDQDARNLIQEDSFIRYVQDLSADEFLGRAPFTKGDTLTVNYIEEQFKNIGLEPGNGDSFFQEVPMAEIASLPANPKWTFEGKNGSMTLNHLDDYVIGSKRLQETINTTGTDLVFAGFGIVAPEFGWNDYEDLDVEGKTVVVMVSDPGYYDKTLFKGDTMTYYGRWTYKFEEASRQGATGVLIIHDTGGASYGWNVVRSGWTGGRLNLQSGDEGMSNTAFEGWITTEAANQLFEIAGVTEDLIAAAKKPGFKPVDLGVKTNMTVNNTIKRSSSNNVMAKLSGSSRPDEYIIYTAHWDHLGVGEAFEGDSIFNGAIDNATGVAALFELAKAFKGANVQPERSIIFMAVTAEEQGLLGSQYYAENPVYPLNKTVGNINMDSFSPAGKTKDISVVGLGQSEMEDYLIWAAEKVGRVVVPGGSPASGSFFRSDHFNFAKVGVPALYSGSGRESVDIDPEVASNLRAEYGRRYHHVHDQFDDTWILSGIMEDIRLLLDVGYALSMQKTFPSWKAGSEFKEIGDKR